MPKFMPGHQMAPSHRRTSEFTEALRYLMRKELGPKGFLKGPKKCTVVQGMVIAQINLALKGDLAALTYLWDRIEGKMDAKATLADLTTTPEGEQMSLKEMARVVGFLLISQAPVEEEIPVIN